MALSVILLLVSFVILGLVVLKGVLSGLKKGVLHALIRLGALVLSVIIALVICLCLRDITVSSVIKLADTFIPSEYSAFEDLLELILQIPASIVLLVLFWLIFSIVRALMLIPQKLICKLLPKTYEEFAKEPQAVPETTEALAEPVDRSIGDEATALDTDPESTTAEAASDEVAANEPAAEVPVIEDASVTANAQPIDGEPTRKNYGKLIWKLSGALCGALSSLLLLGAWLMPVSGIVTRGGDAVVRVADVVAKESKDGAAAENVSRGVSACSNAPLFTVTDFFYGKTVFEPLTTIKTDFGKVSFTEELKNATDIACDILPAIVHLSEEGNIREGDTELITDAARKLAESDLLMSVSTYIVHYSGEQLEKTADKATSPAMREMQLKLSDMMTDMTPSDLTDSIGTVTALVDTLADSPILKAVTDKDAQLKASDLADRETLRNAVGILYDDENARSLIVSMINVGTETILKSMGAEPVYSELDINEISRDEILKETDLICDAAKGLAEFSESLGTEGADLADYQLAAAGRALDDLKGSVIFGKQYDALVTSLSTAVGGDSDDSVISALGDALTTTHSAEALLNSAQSIAVLNKELESGEKKGRDNEKIVASMDTLLNDTAPEDYDALKGVAGNYFTGASSTVDTETQAQMTEDFIGAMTTVSKQTEKDLPAEADAMQAIYDVTHSGSADNSFAKISEDDTVAALLESDIAIEMLSSLNAEGRDYGIRAKLTDSNKTAIENAIDASDASAERKAVVATFFGVN